MEIEYPVFERLVRYEEERLRARDGDSSLVDCEYLDALPTQPEHFVEASVRSNPLIPVPHRLVSPLDERLNRSRTRPEGESFENEIYRVVDYLIWRSFSFHC